MARWRLVGAVVICTLALAACGDSGETSDSNATSDDGGSKTTAANSAAGSDSGSGSGSGLSTSDCLAATQALIAASAGLSLVMSGDNKQFETSLAELNKFAGAAPAAIQKDLKVVAAAYTAYAKALKDGGYKPGQVPDANMIKTMEKAGASMETSEFEKANANVDAWFEKECSR